MSIPLNDNPAKKAARSEASRRAAEARWGKKPAASVPRKPAARIQKAAAPKRKRPAIHRPAPGERLIQTCIGVIPEPIANQLRRELGPDNTMLGLPLRGDVSDGGTGTNTANSVAPGKPVEREIPQAMSLLESALGSLDDAMSMLGARLADSGVLTPEPQTDAAAAGSGSVGLAPGGPSTKLAHRIAESESHVYSLNNRALNLLRRLET